MHNAIDNLVEENGLLDAVEGEVEDQKHTQILNQRPLHHVPKARPVHNVIARIEYRHIKLKVVLTQISSAFPQVLRVVAERG